MKKIITIITSVILLYALYYSHTQTPSTATSCPVQETLVVGTSADYPPYASINLATGEIVGFDIDIVTEVAHRLHKKIQIKDMPFNSLMLDLVAGQIDLIAAGLSPSEQRKKTVTFSRPYLDSDYNLVITKKENPKITSIEDLYNKPVAVNTGYTCDTFLSTIPQIPLVRLESTSDGIMALQANSVYAFATLQSCLELFLKQQDSNHDYQFFKLPIDADGCALAYEKENKVLQEKIDPIIDEMERDGTLHTLKMKWGLA